MHAYVQAHVFNTAGISSPHPDTSHAQQLVKHNTITAFEAPCQQAETCPLSTKLTAVQLSTYKTSNVPHRIAQPHNTSENRAMLVSLTQARLHGHPCQSGKSALMCMLIMLNQATNRTSIPQLLRDCACVGRPAYCQALHNCCSLLSQKPSCWPQLERRISPLRSIAQQPQCCLPAARICAYLVVA